MGEAGIIKEHHEGSKGEPVLRVSNGKEFALK